MGNCSNISNTKTVSLTAGTLTSGFCHTSLQTTYEEFIARTAATISGNTASFVAGDDTPSSGDQDKLWFKQNASNCNDPLGWLFYNTSNSTWENAHPVKDDEVTTAKILDNNVTGAKIAMGSDAQGDVLFHNGTSYARLAAGTDGHYLKTRGASQNPEWSEVPSTPTITIESSSETLANDTTISSIPSGSFLMIGTMQFAMSGNGGVRAHAELKESDGTVIDTVILGAGNEISGTDGGSGMTVRDTFIIGLPSNAASVRIFRGQGSNSMDGEVTQFVKYA